MVTRYFEVAPTQKKAGANLKGSATLLLRDHTSTRQEVCVFGRGLSDMHQNALQHRRLRLRIIEPYPWLLMIAHAEHRLADSYKPLLPLIVRHGSVGRYMLS